MFFSSIFLIQIIITILFLILAVIFDVKSNIVPDKLTYSLLFFGLISNLILSIISNNIKFILASFISMFVTYCITYMFWILKIWGGGDVKLFTAIATVIPIGLNIDFLNIFPKLSIYPFAFSVILNSILVSFPFLIFFLIYLISKNDDFKDNPLFIITLLNVENLRRLIHSSLNKTIAIKDLKEGAIVNNFYFNDDKIIELIAELNGNLEIFENKEDDGFKYYFKSQSAGGITKEEMTLIKVMSTEKFIGNIISVKLAYPFTPSILIGLLIAIFFGDIMMLFAKNMVLVI